jgi:serine/threonine protein kinase
MTPEIHNDEPYGFQADVYSFRILMFLLLTELKPYSEASDYAGTTPVTKHERPTIPASFGQGYKALMDQSWSGVRDARPQLSEIVYRVGEEVCLEDSTLRLRRNIRRGFARVSLPFRS